MDTFALHATVRAVPRLPYQRIKRAVLGDAYRLSLAFVGETRAQTLNKKYRRRAYVPNVLAFPLSKNEGEVVICPSRARREARAHNLTPRRFIGLLFIHGMLHLKGYSHGATMERTQRSLFQSYIP